MKELWKIIAGFEAYEVSNLGRVRRILPSAGSGRKGSSQGNTKVGKILKQTLDRYGYPHIGLYTQGMSGNCHGKTVHRLVAQAFIPNPEGLPQINHKGKKTDNRASMLEWVSTQSHGKDRMKREQQGDGVFFFKTNRKWVARYSPEPNKRVHIGYFDTEEEAKAARKAKVATL